MREKEVRGLMEAYSQVHAPQELTEEQIWEGVENWVNSLLEEGYDLSDYTWEEMYESYLEEAPMTAFQAAGGNAQLAILNKGRGVRSGRVTAADIERQGQDNLFKAGGGNAAISAGGTKQGPRNSTVNKLNRQDIINRGTVVAGAKPSAKPKMPGLPPSAAQPGTGPKGNTVGSKPSAPAAKPAAAATTKPAATTAPKPTTPTKPAGSAMDQWAAANPKLAAAKAERDRTRGTSATTNPLMKDMKSSMPDPKSPAPSTAKTGFDLAKKGVNLAAGVDIFDLVKGHLLDEGYADSEEGAMVMMTNMSEQWRKSILESHGVEILDEISKELATKAFANRATRAFEMDDTEESEKADKTKERIVKKYGKKSGDEAEKAAERGIFGHNKYSEAQERERAKKKVTKEDLEAWVDQLIAEGYDLSEYTWEEVAEICAQELELSESQRARENPEEYERSSEAREGRRRRSGINDPKTGINSPAFQAFMAQQMGGKKKKD